MTELPRIVGADGVSYEEWSARREAAVKSKAPTEADMRQQRSTRIEWMLDGWLHTLASEGRLFRWTSQYVAGARDQQPAAIDLGLHSGGVFAAVLAMQEQIARNHCSRCGSEMAVCQRCDRQLEAEEAGLWDSAISDGLDEWPPP